MRRSVVVRLALLLCALVVAGAPALAAGSSPTPGGTLRYAVAAEPITVSPLQSGGDAASAKMRTALFDPLFYVNYEDGSLRPGLGLSLEAKSPTRWVLKIRPGVQFHKGYGEMTAEDVAFSYNEVLEKKLRSWFSVSALKEARVIDRYTVEFILAEPYAAFPVTSLTDLTMVVSKKAYLEFGPEKFNRNPIGTGPFEFVRWVPGNRITVRRHDEYWRSNEGLPYLDAIEFLIVPDAFVRLSMLRTGQADVVEAPDLKDVEALRAESGIVVHEVVGHTWHGILFSAIKKDHPFLDARVRRAVNLALDRSQIVTDVYYGHAVTTDVPVPPGFFGRPKNRVYGDQPNLVEAKRLLAAAGYANGFEATLMSPNSQNMVREAEVIAGQLAKIGIKVKIEALDSGTYNSKLIGTHDFEMALQDVVVVSPDPDSPIYWFHYPGTQHYHGWNNPALAELLKRGRELTSRAEREPIYLKAVDLIRQENAFIYTVHTNEVEASRSYVKDWKTLPTVSRLYPEVWLDK